MLEIVGVFVYVVVVLSFLSNFLFLSVFILINSVTQRV